MTGCYSTDFLSGWPQFEPAVLHCRMPGWQLVSTWRSHAACFPLVLSHKTAPTFPILFFFVCDLITQNTAARQLWDSHIFIYFKYWLCLKINSKHLLHRHSQSANASLFPDNEHGTWLWHCNADKNNMLNMSHSQSCVAVSVQLRRSMKNMHVSVVLPNWLLKSF